MQTSRQESHARAISRHRSLSGLYNEAHGVRGLFSNQDILPVQFHCSPHGLYHEIGEIALMYAVLQDAINCFQRSAVSGTRRARRPTSEAEAWFFATEDNSLFSFANICTVLGLDPEYMRLGLKRWRQCRVVRPPQGRLPVVRRSQPSKPRNHLQQRDCLQRTVMLAEKRSCGKGGRP
jgi:hypothetical protein